MKNANEEGQDEEATKVIHVPVPPDLLEALDAFIVCQEFPVSRVAVMRRALEQFMAAREQGSGPSQVEILARQILHAHEQRVAVPLDWSLALAQGLLDAKRT